MIYKVYNDQYVAAVIEGEFELAQWLISVPQDRIAIKELRIEPIRLMYPFQIIESIKDDKRVFFPVSGDPSETKAMKNLFESAGFKILAIFTIEKDFRGDPKNPGLDYMGILPHEHEEEDEEDDEIPY